MAMVRRGQLGPYQLQAAINAVHAGADSVEETDRGQIVALYDQLLSVAPTPVMRLNRAVAVAEVDGPAAGLALLDGLDPDGYYPFHATRADLLRRLDQPDEAITAYTRAALTGTDHRRTAYLTGQAHQLSTP
jgi:RNA polymerase sigma-70 factor (ECF subfamily)